MTPPDDATPEVGDEEGPGLPGIRSWGWVYGVVLGAFVVMVVLLTWFTRAFS